VQTASKVTSATNAALEEKAWKVSPRNIQGMNSFKKQAQFAIVGAVCVFAWRCFLTTGYCRKIGFLFFC
jgi:hypothetical protein